jgi:hypothetical protein
MLARNLDIINMLSKGPGYKINTQKSVAALHTNNEQCEKEYYSYNLKKIKIPKSKFNEGEAPIK